MDQDGILKQQLIQLLNSANRLQKGISNLNLLDHQAVVDEIMPYSGRYFVMSSDQIQNEANFLAKTYEEARSVADEAEKVGEIAINALEKTGHSRLSIVDKDPGELAKVIYYKKIAALGVLRAFAKKKNMIISKNDVKDCIAEVLVADEEGDTDA